jgi:hypothetical protein
LHEAGAIAEIDKEQTAEVAAAVHPSPQSNPLSHVFKPKRTARMGAKRSGERRVFRQRVPRVVGTRKISDTSELSE